MKKSPKQKMFDKFKQKSNQIDLDNHLKLINALRQIKAECLVGEFLKNQNAQCPHKNVVKINNHTECSDCGASDE